MKLHRAISLVVMMLMAVVLVVFLTAVGIANFDTHSLIALGVVVAAAGERTARVALGTSVATPTFRYHPAIVAQAFGTLGLLLPERMILGVGTGEHLNEGALGVQWPENRERFARLREAVRLIRRLWSEQSVTFDGEYYHTRNATIYDRPEKPVPIYIGAGGPQVARYAGRAGDGLICTSGKGMELYTDQLLPSFR